MPTARDFDLDPPAWSSQPRLHFEERIILAMERMFYRNLDALKLQSDLLQRSPFTVPVPLPEQLANFRDPVIRKAMILATYKKSGPHGVYQLLSSMAHAAREIEHQNYQRLVDLNLEPPQGEDVRTDSPLAPPSLLELNSRLGGLNAAAG